MKPLLGPTFLLAATVLFLAGCDPDAQGHNQPKPKQPGGFATPVKHDTHSTDTAVDTTGEEPGTTPHEKKERAPQAPDPTPPTPPTPKVTGGAPEYAKAVPGKPGFVTSPYKPYDGLVDVRGFAPGTELEDPYAKGKTFLVPAQ